MSRSEQEGEDPRPDPSRRDRYRHHDGASSPDDRREERRMRHRQNGDRSRNGDSLHEDRRRDEKSRHRKEDRGTRRRDEHLESPHCDERKAGRSREAESQDGGRREDRSRSGKDDRKRHREDDERDDNTQHGRERHSREEMDGRRANVDFDGEHRRRKEDKYGSRKEEHDGHRKEESKRDERGGSYKVEEADSRHRNGSKQQGKGIEAKETTNRGEPQLNGEKEKSSKNQPPKEMPLGRTGGVYVPPFKLAQMMKDIQDKSSAEYQRMTWDALRKSINGLVNKVNASNIKNILPELFSENLIRGRGLFARSCMKSQMASPAFTHVFAGLVAVVNTKFPELGELLLKRVTLQFRRALKRNEKPVLLAAAKFIAHLVNQQVAHELVALEVLMVLLETPTDDSVEVAVGFVKECGARLQDLAPQGLHGIFERFRGILHEGEIDKRVQFMIEGLFAIRKANFQGHPAVLPELDLVEQEDQFTHEISLSDDLDGETGLDIFKADPNFLENEKKYESVRKEILGEESEDDGEESENESDEDSEDSDEDEDDIQKIAIKDETETNLVNLRRTIYLTIMSSVDFEEAGHKLLKIKLEPGQEMELCIMLLECCSQERTYLRYYGLLGQRFCMINRVYQENFDECFMKQYSMIHRLETNKLRNVAKFFAHLLGTDALPWNSLGYIRLTEEDTTSSSRIFIKILFQELSEHLGLRKLNERLSDPIMQDSYEGIFPKDNPKNTRFAINFFTSIGLGGITDSLREHLKNMPRLIMQQQKPIESEGEESSEPSDSSTESETSSSETDSASSGSDTETESQSPSESDSQERRKRRKKK